jgi:B9 domain-containing protein 1
MFSHGPDWDIVAGIDCGLSQTACKSSLSSNHREVVWNFPIDVSFKSTNIHGWPRVAVSVYGIDYLGRDVIRGYGSLLIPLQPGTHALQIEMFVPVANSTLNDFFSWILGNPPEVCDAQTN